MQRFIICCSLGPKSKKYLDPFFAEIAQDGVVFLVSLFVVIVICPCPGRAVDTGKCPVVECPCMTPR